MLSCLPLVVLSSVSVSMRLPEEEKWKCESLTSVYVTANCPLVVEAGSLELKIIVNYI